MSAYSPDVWPGVSEEEFTRVGEAVRRLAGVSEAAGYWTPIGKVVETLTYATEPGPRERLIIAFVLGLDVSDPESAA